MHASPHMQASAGQVQVSANVQHYVFPAQITPSSSNVGWIQDTQASNTVTSLSSTIETLQLSTTNSDTRKMPERYVITQAHARADVHAAQWNQK